MPQPRIGKKVWEEKMASRTEVEATTPPSLQLPHEYAADVLFGFLPDDTQMFIREVVTNMQLPLWQVILGYVMRCADRQELFSPHILSAWESGRRPSIAHPCEHCGLEFISKFPDAKYCCNRCYFKKGGHSEGCPVKPVVEATA